MRHKIGISMAFTIVLTLSMSITPKVMVVDLTEVEKGVYTSTIFNMPVYISEAKLEFSVLLDTYCRVTLEIRAGQDYLRFHLNEAKVSYHFSYEILDFFGSLTSRDVSLKVKIDTDGVIEEVPHIAITYYGLW